MLDLDYSEDVRAEVDMNVVMTGAGRFVEVQGTAEGAAFSRGGARLPARPRRAGDRPDLRRCNARCSPRRHRRGGREDRSCSRRATRQGPRDLPRCSPARGRVLPRTRSRPRTAPGSGSWWPAPTRSGPQWPRCRWWRSPPRSRRPARPSRTTRASRPGRCADGHRQLPAVADDTGLEVDALGGAPGVRAARYAGDRTPPTPTTSPGCSPRSPGCSRAERTARFATVALARCPDGAEHVAQRDGRG